MLPGLTLPASLAGLLGSLRPCFTGPSYRTFCGLVAGLCGQVQRRTVCGMLLGAHLSRAWPHDRAHYFFARARWEADRLGLAVAQLAVMALVMGVASPLFMKSIDASVGEMNKNVSTNLSGRSNHGTEHGLLSSGNSGNLQTRAGQK